MKKIIVSGALIALITNLNTYAQMPEDITHICGTSHMQEKAIQENPAIADSLAKWELTANQPGMSEKAAKVFPIVIHIVHTYDGNWIGNDQVYDAIRILNEDYQGLNSDLANVIPAFQGIVDNPDFEFRLARKDPQGNCTNGITRTFWRRTVSADDDVKQIAPQWDPSKYINVWIIQVTENGSGGYAYLPGTAAFMPGRDGIVLRSSQFGSIGASGGSTLAKRSLTHEIGHYFNLNHTWGGSNTPGLASNCNMDDNVSDTPNTIGVGNASCNTAQSTCGVLDNVQNIMDYASCPLMFTQGQSTRMTNAANSATANRNNLSTAANRLATGINDGYSDTICVPLADFYTAVRTVCKGGSLQIRDFSWRGTATSYNWEVSNGSTTLTSTQANPTFTFNETGYYNVKLTVGNSAGSNTITRNNYIVVSDTQAEFGSNGYQDDFENGPISSQRWYVINDNNLGWQQTTLASTSGTTSLRIANVTADTLSVYTLISPTYDFTQVPDVTLKFKYAYARRSNSSGDRLRISMSVNCGQTWNVIYNFSSSALSTAPNTNANFVPLASQWKEATVAVPSTFKNKPNVRIKFDFINGNGNNFYMDDLNIPGVASTQEEFNAQNFLTIMPNPNNGSFQVSLDMESAGNGSLRLIDMAGKTVATQNLPLSAGKSTHALQFPNLSTGVYWLSIQTEKGLLNEKIVIQ